MPSVLVSMVALTSIAVSPLAADEAQYGPAELLADRAADGFEFVENGSTGELTYDEFVDIAPEAVAHLDPTSTEASNLKAAIRLWASPDDEAIVTEIIESVSDDGAAAIVEQSASYAGETGLSAVDPPFEGAMAFAGDDDGARVNLVAWRHGTYAVWMTHIAGEDADPSVIEQAADFQAEALRGRLGVDVTRASPASDTASSGGGIPIVTVLFWLVVIGAGIWLFMKFRKRLRGQAAAPDRDEPSDTDDIIERARARARAREEVELADGPDLTSGEWKVPDDY